jgi:L-ribulose-5-phosphate 3-epimerase UlaE
VTGTRKVIAIHVKDTTSLVTQATSSSSRSKMSNEIFGTGGDPFNLLSVGTILVLTISLSFPLLHN